LPWTSRSAQLKYGGSLRSICRTRNKARECITSAFFWFDGHRLAQQLCTLQVHADEVREIDERGNKLRFKPQRARPCGPRLILIQDQHIQLSLYARPSGAEPMKPEVAYEEHFSGGGLGREPAGAHRLAKEPPAKAKSQINCALGVSLRNSNATPRRIRPAGMTRSGK
jgi:hypothetical protein